MMRLPTAQEQRRDLRIAVQAAVQFVVNNPSTNLTSMAQELTSTVAIWTLADSTAFLQELGQELRQVGFVDSPEWASVRDRIVAVGEEVTVTALRMLEDRVWQMEHVAAVRSQAIEGVVGPALVAVTAQITEVETAIPQSSGGVLRALQHGLFMLQNEKRALELL